MSSIAVGESLVSQRIRAFDQGAATASTTTGRYKKKTPLTFNAKSVQLDQGADARSKVTGEYESQMQLRVAIRERNEAAVKLLLDQGVEVDCEATGYHEGRTPLSFAAEKGHEVIIKTLLDYGANTNSKATGRYKGWTPLIFAVRQAHVLTVELLLDHEADANVYPIEGYESRALLSFAAEHGQKAIVKLLLNHGAEAEKTTDFEEGRTPLSFAAAEGHKDITKILLNHRANIDSISRGLEGGRTPLSFAAEKGHEDITELLLNHGADINSMATGVSEGRTPLSFAANGGHKAVVKHLLDQGANADLEVTEPLYKNNPPWDRDGNPIIAKLQDSNGASRIIGVKGGWTPLSFAATKGHEAIVDLLLGQGTDTDSKATGFYRGTPLSYTTTETARDDKTVPIKEVLSNEKNSSAAALDSPEEPRMTRARASTTEDAMTHRNKMPSIRFSTCLDPERRWHSLSFNLTLRTPPTGDEVIMIGRYSEQDSHSIIPTNTLSAATVSFNSKCVSRQHCEFSYDQGKWYIKDLKSSLGTFVNDTRLSPPRQESPPYLLSDGDIVQLGVHRKKESRSSFGVSR